MRHGVDGRKLGRNTSHRIALFRNLANCVINNEQIVTTVPKAKEARRVVDRLITLGKSGKPASRRLAFNRTRDKAVVDKLFGELAERYKVRNGGYTRVLKMSDARRGDAAEMAVLELVDHPVIDRKRKVKPAAESTSNTGDSAEGAATAPTDPFSRFRKMFTSKKDKGASKVSSGRNAGAAKRTPAKKPAARSNKSGGA